MPDTVRDHLIYMQTLRAQVDNLRATRGAFGAFKDHLTEAIGDSARETLVTTALGHTKPQIAALISTVTAFYDALATDYPGIFYEEPAPSAVEGGS